MIHLKIFIGKRDGEKSCSNPKHDGDERGGRIRFPVADEAGRNPSTGACCIIQPMNSPAPLDFLGIGAPRAGTTWLWTVLRQHPQIWMPPRKELHYFDRNEKYPSASHLQHERLPARMFGLDKSSQKWRRVFGTDVYYLLTGKNKAAEIPWLARYHFGRVNDAWYLSLFENRPSRVRGEITPAYCMLDMEDVQRVHALLPEVKILYTLRDPVERSWSQIRFGMGRRGLAINEQAMPEIQRRTNSLSQQLTGDYVGTLKKWRAVYPAERMFILFQDQIEREPEQLTHSLYRVLGVDESFQLPAGILRRKVNASAESEMPSAVRRLLVESHYPQVVELNKMIGGYTNQWLDSYRAAM